MVLVVMVLVNSYNATCHVLVSVLIVMVPSVTELLVMMLPVMSWLLC